MATASTRDEWEVEGGTCYEIFTDIWDGVVYYPDDEPSDWYGFCATEDGVAWEWRTKTTPHRARH